MVVMRTHLVLLGLADGGDISIYSTPLPDGAAAVLLSTWPFADCAAGLNLAGIGCPARLCSNARWCG